MGCCPAQHCNAVHTSRPGPAPPHSVRAAVPDRQGAFVEDSNPPPLTAAAPSVSAIDQQIVVVPSADCTAPRRNAHAPDAAVLGPGSS